MSPRGIAELDCPPSAETRFPQGPGDRYPWGCPGAQALLHAVSISPPVVYPQEFLGTFLAAIVTGCWNGARGGSRERDEATT